MKGIYVIIFTLIAIIGFSPLLKADLNKIDERMYIDESDLSHKDDGFHIHIGHNIWLTTHSMHRDHTGLFIYERNLSRLSNSPKAEYVKTWKCPYCHLHWPIGQSCQNSSCPSKYK